MKIHESSKTKIIATMGPACAEESKLRGLIYAGIDICRLNFSHSSYDEHAEMIERIHKINAELGSHVGILADLQGPKIRLGMMEDGVVMQEGDQLIFTNELCTGNQKKVYISYPDLPRDAKAGDIMLVDDGKLKFKVVSTNGTNEVVAVTVHGGPLKSKKGVNLPHTKISIPSLTEKDLRDVEFILDHDLDWIALSFVRWAKDITDLREIIKKRNKKTLIVAKIEKPEALEELDAIIEASDAVMVARGDLGVEVSFEKVPFIQKQIVEKCIRRYTPVIIATQMLESMIENFRPTRAEANDVGNAVFDSADTVMLSGETSVGKFPIEAIQSMQRIIDYAEPSAYVQKYKNKPDRERPTFIPDSVCYNACKMADQAEAKAIVAFAAIPQTAFRLASHRPSAPIYIFTNNHNLERQLSMAWGVRSFFVATELKTEEAFRYSIDILKEKGLLSDGDTIVQVGSIPLFSFDGSNTVKLSYV